MTEILKIIAGFLVIMGLFLILNRFNYHYHLFHAVLIYCILPVLFILYIGISAQLHQLKVILHAIVDITVVIACISLVFWFMGELGYPANCSLLLGWGGHRVIFGFYGLYYFTQEPAHFLGTMMIRNTSIFSEAPMYSVILTTAFIINLFYLKHNRFFRFNCLVILLTLITTVATSGILICFLACLGYFMYLNRDKFNRFTKKQKISYTVSSLIIILTVVSAIIINKLNTFSGSVSIRSDDIRAGLKAFINHPFIGNGIGNNAAIKHYMAHYRLVAGGNTGFSLGLIQIMAFGGLMLLFIYLIPLIKSLLSKDYLDLYIILLLLLMLALTIINEAPLFIFILVFIYMKQKGFGGNFND
ncbi:hypothetical protein ACQW5G_04890 [Fructilactobacillus sp. Tb1]|uniref:hypothetical protein n=1 Tax=Fructilactobacillus sp. Tb1 TaxID=3422304 RepID=UPI003D2B200E